jgi:26S proteasome regulatory subunit (ATPase 3-interacting protein)
LKRIERELQAHYNEQCRKLKELENEVRSEETTFNSLKCSMTLEEAQKERDRLEEYNIQLSSKLNELMENSGTGNLSQLKKETESNLKKYNHEYSKRKRICNDILDCILESYPGSKKQLFAEIGINIV